LAKLEGYSEVFYLLGELAFVAKGSVQFLFFTAEEVLVYLPGFGPVNMFWTGEGESGVSDCKSSIRGVIDGEDWFWKQEFDSLICYGTVSQRRTW
jgi:hypothetical protein